MADIYLGSTDLSSADFYLGSSTVSALYKGSDKVWPAAAAGFDPTLGGTLTLGFWHDLTDTNYLTLNGSEVTAVTDKTGNGFNLSKYTATGPTFTSATAGTYFNGSNLLYDPSGNPLPSVINNKTYQTVITMFKAPTISTLMRVVHATTDYAADWQYLALHNSTLWSTTYTGCLGSGANYAYFHLYNNAGGDPAAAQMAIQANTEYMFSAKMVWTGTNSYNMYASVNDCAWGTAKSATQSDQSRTDEYWIGARGAGFQNPYTGYVKHVFAYEADLTDQNIADIYANYIANP